MTKITVSLSRRNYRSVFLSTSFLVGIIAAPLAAQAQTNTSISNRPGAQHDQVGTGNFADTFQDNDSHISRIRQRGTNNSATVRQTGTSQTSVVDQAVGDNRAFVEQSGAGNLSEAIQESRGNTAIVRLGQGAVLAPNRSLITQRNTLFDPAVASNNVSDVAIIGQGNRSVTTQNGRNNNANVSMLAGGAGGNQSNPDDATVFFEGNRSTVTQTGQNHNAVLSIGARDIGIGKGNTSDVRQGGTRTGAEVYQRGLQDQSTITQTGQGQVFANGEQARAFASVSQLTTRGISRVDQVGDNFAEVTQGFGTASISTVDQIDSGDLDPLAPENLQSPGATTRQSNQGRIAQNGDRNVATIRQNARNASADIFQQRGLSQSSALVEQGRGTVDAAAFRTPPTVPAAGTSRNVSASLIQNGIFNVTTVRQDGVTITARAEQFGRGTDANKNSIKIEQTGSEHTATARQFSGVGPSAPGDTAAGSPGEFRSHPGGVRSAEIVILQSNRGNSATVEQFGRGQFAEIEQTGQFNTAGIRQDENATNAVGVIRQTGNGNSFFINQTQPGQFTSVSQTGNNNLITLRVDALGTNVLTATVDNNLGGSVTSNFTTTPITTPPLLPLTPLPPLPPIGL